MQCANIPSRSLRGADRRFLEPDQSRPFDTAYHQSPHPIESIKTYNLGLEMQLLPAGRAAACQSVQSLFLSVQTVKAVCSLEVERD